MRESPLAQVGSHSEESPDIGSSALMERCGGNGFWRQLVQLALDSLNVETIRVFGSRARGDHRPKSDIDLAFEFPREKKSHWADFVTRLEDEAEVLLSLDLVDLDECHADLRKEILKEGKILYDRRRAL